MLSPKARETLFASPWLRGLAPRDVEKAAHFFEEQVVSQGTILYRAGQEGHTSYIVVTGAIDVAVNGREMRLPPGSPFGLVAHAGGSYAGTACAALDCRLLVLRESGWKQLVDLHPRAWVEASRALVRQLQLTMGRETLPVGATVGITSHRPWRYQRRLVIQLAEAMERELGRTVAIVTIGSRQTTVSPARPNGLDVVVMGNPNNPAELRGRVTTTVGELADKVPYVLAEFGPEMGDVALGIRGDLLVEHVVGDVPPSATRHAGRVIRLHDRREGHPPSLSSSDIVVLPLDTRDRRRAISRLARHICGRSVGVALGSGAAWGLAHIGVLDALDAAGIPVDLVAGSSMGAIVGAHYALGMPPAELRDIATRVQSMKDLVRILPELAYLAADFNLMRPGFFAGEHFKKVLAAMAPITGQTFADLEIPFRAIATDIENGGRVDIGDGELADAIQASFSAPAVLSPQRIDGRVLIDGGMVEPVPSETVRAMGADIVIAVNVVPPLNPAVRNPLDRVLHRLDELNPLSGGGGNGSPRLPNAFEVMVRTLQIMQYRLGNDRAGEADVLINPALSDFWILEFWKAAEMIERGAEATREMLPHIRAKLAERQNRTSTPAFVESSAP
jgi:NTE family protein